MSIAWAGPVPHPGRGGGDQRRHQRRADRAAAVRPGHGGAGDGGAAVAASSGSVLLPLLALVRSGLSLTAACGAVMVAVVPAT
jgi:hypothetical protein